MKDKKSYIMDMADLSRKSDLKSHVSNVSPKRRAIMTSDRDEEFINKYYMGRTDCLRRLLIDDMKAKGWE